MFYKKGVLTTSEKLTTKKLHLWPVTLFKKRLCYKHLNVVKLLRIPFLMEPLRWLLLVFCFKQIFSSFYIKMTELQELYYTNSFTNFFPEFTKLNPKAVDQMYSIKKLFLEICQDPQENICARVSFSIKLQPFRLLIVY